MQPVERQSNVLQILQELHVISPTVRKLLEQYVLKWHVAPFEAVLLTNILNEESLAKMLADYAGVEFLSNLAETTVDRDAVFKVRFKQASALRCLPLALRRSEPSVLRVVLADPTCAATVATLRQTVSMELEVCAAPKSDILYALYRAYPPRDQLSKD